MSLPMTPSHVPLAGENKPKTRMFRYVNGYAIPVDVRPSTVSGTTRRDSGGLSPVGGSPRSRPSSRGSEGGDMGGFSVGNGFNSPGSGGSPRLRPVTAPQRQPSTQDPADRFLTSNRQQFLDTGDVEVSNSLSIAQHNNLAFRAYFNVDTPMSSLEKQAARPVTIILHRSDNTITIKAEAEINSGLEDAIILKKQSVPRSRDDPSPITWKDFNVGAPTLILGRMYHITDCDYFTKNFLREQGVEVPGLDGGRDIPVSRHQLHRAHLDKPTNARALAEQTGRGYDRAMANIKRKNFLEKDGMVLTFNGTWDDSGEAFGDKHEMSVQYFMVDGTLEVKVVGEDDVFSNKVLLSRTVIKVPGTDRPLQPEDLELGGELNVFGRKIYLHDCNDYTLDFNAQLGRDWRKMRYQMREQKKAAAARSAPGAQAKRGLATMWQVDVSDGPRKPTKALTKLLANEGKVLRFSAHLDSVRSVDQDREFILSYFLADDTVSVHEKPLRNSGLVTGKFLERCYTINPATGEYFSESDFFVGAVIELNKHKFVLDNADIFVSNYSESVPDKFPQSNLAIIVDKLRHLCASLDGDASGTTAEEVEELFRRIDADGNGYITVAEFRDAIQGFFGEDAITPQETLTLVRRFDMDGDGRIDAAEFAVLIKP